MTVSARSEPTYPAPETAQAEAAPVRRWASGRRVVLTVAVYLAGSLALHHRLLPKLATATAGWTSSDSYQFIWWIRRLPWSLAHGANPLFTTYITPRSA